VLRVGADSVRLGVVASPSVPVHRLEIYEQIQRENRAAAAAPEDVRTLALRLRRAGQKDEPPDERAEDAGKDDDAAKQDDAGKEGGAGKEGDAGNDARKETAGTD